MRIRLAIRAEIRDKTVLRIPETARAEARIRDKIMVRETDMEEISEKRTAGTRGKVPAVLILRLFGFLIGHRLRAVGEFSGSRVYNDTQQCQHTEHRSGNGGNLLANRCQIPVYPKEFQNLSHQNQYCRNGSEPEGRVFQPHSPIDFHGEFTSWRRQESQSLLYHMRENTFLTGFLKKVEKRTGV